MYTDPETVQLEERDRDVSLAGMTKRLYAGAGGRPDNHVGPGFLAGFHKAKVPRRHTVGSTMLSCAGGGQQLCSIWLLLLLYRRLLDSGELDEAGLMVAGFVVIGTAIPAAFISRCSAGVADRSRSPPPQEIATSAHSLLRTVGYVGVLFALSPVLNSLTDSISTNTIHVMAGVMLAVNLLLNEYRPTPRTMHLVPGGALNAGTFAAVCLASRLPSALHAFVFTLVAMFCFALWPPIRVQVRSMSWKLELAQTAVIMAVTVSMITAYWATAAVWLGLQLIALLVVCPWLFVRLQSLKRVYSGPWDEAIVDKVPKS